MHENCLYDTWNKLKCPVLSTFSGLHPGTFDNNSLVFASCNQAATTKVLLCKENAYPDSASLPDRAIGNFTKRTFKEEEPK